MKKYEHRLVDPFIQPEDKEALLWGKYFMLLILLLITIYGKHYNAAFLING